MAAAYGAIRHPAGTRCSWVALFAVSFIVVILQGPVVEGRQIPRIKSCHTADTWFRQRRMYTYRYTAEVDTGFTGASDVITGSVLKCFVIVSVPKRCEVNVELTRCKLQEKGLNGKTFLSPGSKKLASELERYPLYVQIDKGRVLGQQIVVDRREPAYVTNIKRAIVSQLQLPILPIEEYERPLVHHDLFGECPMQVSFDARSESVFTKRDVSSCKVPIVSGRQDAILSFAKQFQLKFIQQPLDTMLNPFESQLDCRYKLKRKMIFSSTCLHNQAFKPFTFGGEYRAATSLNVTQTLSLEKPGRLHKDKTVVKRVLNGRKIVGLMMEQQVAPPRAVTSSHVHAELDQVLITYSAQSDDLPPEKFRSFVDVLRDAQAGVLERALETLVTCRGASGCPLEQFSGQLDPKVVQKLRESFFTDGLLSCGTEACMSTYVTCLQRGLVMSVEGELSLFNLALFYRPDPDVLHKMLALCKAKSSNNCWLSMGTLVNKMATQVRDSQDRDYVRRGKAAIKKILHQLRVALGDTCRRGILPKTVPGPEHLEKLDSVLVTLKTLGNAGGAIQEFHDDLQQNGKDIVQAVSHCINNAALPNKISTAALMVFQKLDMEKSVRTALSDLLSDYSRDVSLRTMAFDRLVRHEDKGLVQELGDLINKEKMSSLKTYMVTRVGHLLESNDPRTKSLRDIWRLALRQRATYLPELETLRGRGSQYAEFSRYVELPLSRSQNGAKLGVSVVFEPASVVPSSLRVSFSFLLDNRSMELLDVGLDMQGFENIARELLGPGLDLKQGLGALIARVMQAVLPRKGEIPTLFFHDKKVAEALKKLFVKVNMPTGDAPQAQFHIKVFGYEVGFIHLEDLIRMVNNRPRNDKEPQRILTLAQKLSEGLQFFFGKSTKMVEIVKVIPTVAGLPWHADVQATMVASTMLNAGGDIQKFMSRKGPLEIKGGLTMSVGVKVTCEGTVRVGEVTSSGLRLNISVLVNSGVEGRLKYAPVPERKGVPGAQVLELGLGALKRPLNIVSIRSDIYQLHNGEEKAIETPRTQVTVRKCEPKFVQTWSGQKICVEGFYQRLSFSTDSPMPAVSGPIHLDVLSRPVDKSLKEYAATFTMTRQVEKPGNPGMLMVFRANFSAPGDKLKRKFDVLVRVNPTTKALHVLSTVPEFGLRYGLDLNSTYGKPGTSVHHQMSSLLNMGPKLIHSFITEFKYEQDTKQIADPSTQRHTTYNVSEMFFKVNVSVPGLSMEVVTSTSSEKTPGVYTQGIQARYYCEPQLGILYALHAHPKLAAQNDHVSVWSLSNMANMTGKTLADTWSAHETTIITLPGHNITLLNQITANYTFAERDSTIYWTSNVDGENETTDIIRMEAEVRNNSVGRQHNIQYNMHLEHEDKYDVTLNGKLKGTLMDMRFKTDVVFKKKAKRVRERRSLKDIVKRLKRIEEEVETAVETAEEMVVRRGAEITEAFLRWMSGETAASPSSKPKKQGEGAGSAVHVFDPSRRIGPLVRLLSRPEWKVAIDANIKFQPKMALGIPIPTGYNCGWDVHITFPDLQKDLLYSNGTFQHSRKWNMDSDFHVHSDVFNFTLDYLMQQYINSPMFYHFHRWDLAETTKHRFDRSFVFLVDLQRHDHFVYSMDLTSPRTNLSHAINFSTADNVRTVSAQLDLHSERPPFDINYREMSNLTVEGLKTDLTLNSTWLDLTMDMDINFSTRGAIYATQRLDAFGKVPFLNGSSRIETELKMDKRKRRVKPSLTVNRTDSEGHVATMLGQLMDSDLVLFTFTSRKPGSKKEVKLLDWYIRLLEPTQLQHSLQWEAPMTQTFFNKTLYFYTAGARTFKMFGQTVADNVYRNITDMVVPFTNLTISHIVDRVVQGQMKKIALAGLDPKTNVPLTVKVLKGELKAVQALQIAWQNSQMGKLLYTVGVHRLVSEAARISTSCHYMVVQDPVFPVRQFIKFRIMPHVAQIAASRQFNFTVPLPVVWDHYLTRPRPRLLSRQSFRRAQMMADDGKISEYPFVAIVTRSKIQTFDGITYDITVPRHAKCTYLLATDLVMGNYSVLLSHHNAALAMREASVLIAWDGAVKINQNKKKINELPANLTSDHAAVNFTDGQLTVEIHGQVLVTYDPLSQIYIVETARHVHNRSLGLLGTPTHESGDDFLLPTGQMAPRPYNFQENYELSGHALCKNIGGTVSGSACVPKYAKVCTELFQELESPLADCFPTVNPEQFLDLCMRRVCEVLPNNPGNMCPIARTYVKMCARRHKNVTANTKSFLKSCGSCRTSGSSDKRVDVVFASALFGTDRTSINFAGVISNLVNQLGTGTRYGLVHSDEQNVHAHLFDGQLFTTDKAVKAVVNSQSRNKGDKVQKVDVALDIASNYPFRSDARRFIVLVAGTKTTDLDDMSKLQKVLWKRDISLVLVSDDLDSQRVLAVSWDRKVLCQGCRENKIAMPTSVLGKLVTVTRGMWMSANGIERGRNQQMKKLKKQFNRIAKQPAAQCAGMSAKGA